MELDLLANGLVPGFVPGCRLAFGGEVAMAARWVSMEKGEESTRILVSGSDPLLDQLAEEEQSRRTARAATRRAQRTQLIDSALEAGGENARQVLELLGVTVE